MYRVELQYHDIGPPEELDASKIPSYPLNDAMQSVAGRNIAGAAWDLLAAKQVQMEQAMQRAEQFRAMAAAAQVPPVFVHPPPNAGPPGPQGDPGRSSGGELKIPAEL